MGFDWSTFVLEIVNFLILVYLLKRFLYQPILHAIEAREQRVTHAMTAGDPVELSQAVEVAVEFELTPTRAQLELSPASEQTRVARGGLARRGDGLHGSRARAAS